MEGIELRTSMRARRSSPVLDRVADQLLGGGGPQGPRLWGERGPAWDAAAERERIRAASHRRHERIARRRRAVVGLVRLV
jgi:hypothetical protein